MHSTPIAFIVKNIANPAKMINIFNRQINPGESVDLMKIPGVNEVDVRNSLLNGVLKNRINSGHLEITSAPAMDSADISNSMLNVIGPGNLIQPIPITPGIVKNLTNSEFTPLFRVDLSKTYEDGNTSMRDNSFGGKIFFSTECTDGLDVQIIEGDIHIALVMKNNTITNVINANAVEAINITTGGLLSNNFTWTTSGTIATLNVAAISTLTPTNLRIHYFLLHSTHKYPAFYFV